MPSGVRGPGLDESHRFDPSSPKPNSRVAGPPIGGWGIGTMPIKMVGKAGWIPANIDQIDLIHVHQDQVMKLPPRAVRLAQSDFCQNAAFVIDNTVFAIQGHPEFTPAYTNALINIREDKIGKERAATARVSLKKPHDGRQVGGWILDFFATHDPIY